MGLIEIKKDPTSKDLAWFGLALLALFGVIGSFAWRWSTGPLVAYSFWSAGILIVAAYYALPSVRRPLFVGWMYATYPIGWAVSHALLALIYFGVLTPIGLLMRMAGRDPMNRRFDRGRTSYWSEREQVADVKRYFRQF